MLRRALMLLLAFAPATAIAASKKPQKVWEPSGETYLVLPLSQDIYYPANDRKVSVDAWGVGYRMLASQEGFSRTVGLQLQRVNARNAAIGVDGGFYLVEVLVGGGYISPPSANKLRFTASAMADLGFAGGGAWLPC